MAANDIWTETTSRPEYLERLLGLDRGPATRPRTEGGVVIGRSCVDGVAVEAGHAHCGASRVRPECFQPRYDPRLWSSPPLRVG